MKSWLHRNALRMLVLINGFLAFCLVVSMVDAFQNPEEYHFGSEAMGGWPYDSLLTYELAFGMDLAVIVLAGLAAYISQSWRFRLMALLLPILLMVFFNVDCYLLGGCS